MVGLPIAWPAVPVCILRERDYLIWQYGSIDVHVNYTRDNDAAINPSVAIPRAIHGHAAELVDQ